MGNYPSANTGSMYISLVVYYSSGSTYYLQLGLSSSTSIALSSISWTYTCKVKRLSIPRRASVVRITLSWDGPLESISDRLRRGFARFLNPKLSPRK